MSIRSRRPGATLLFPLLRTTLTFQSSLGGGPVSHTQLLNVYPKKPK